MSKRNTLLLSSSRLYKATMWNQLSIANSANRQQLDSNSQQLLNQILENLKIGEQSGKKSLLIFDIDSTLIDTSYRTAAIFKEFAKQAPHKDIWPDLCKQIRDWQDLVEVYDPIDFLNQHAGMQIERNSNTGHYILRFWKERFFDELWLSHDRPYAGGREFVYQCLHEGADIAYLTGREESTALEGTKRWLSTHRFPLLDKEKRTRLMLKENHQMKDHLYKAEGLKKLKQGYDLICFFENEVELILMAKQEHPEINSILFDSVHSGRSELGTNQVDKIRAWIR